MSKSQQGPSPRIDPSIKNAHSLAEAKLYLLAQKCDACGRGPVRAVASEMSDDSAGEIVATISARCDACATEAPHRFRLPRSTSKAPFRRADGDHQGEETGTPSPVDTHVVNPTDHPSELLDVGQWITLAVMLTESAERETDAVIARQLRIEAGLCIDEAIKFYTDDENDLPPPQALFTDDSRDRFRRHPEQFSRRRLRSMRLRLPNPTSTG